MNAKYVSKLWRRRYEQPRDAAGRFKRGVFLWERLKDKQSRWLEWPEVEYDGWIGPTSHW